MQLPPVFSHLATLVSFLLQPCHFSYPHQGVGRQGHTLGLPDSRMTGQRRSLLLTNYPAMGILLCQQKMHFAQFHHFGGTMSLVLTFFLAKCKGQTKEKGGRWQAGTPSIWRQNLVDFLCFCLFVLLFQSCLSARVCIIIKVLILTVLLV